MKSKGACTNTVLIVAAIGVSGSGKTTTIEYLVSQLSIQGYKIGTIKHVHHNGFTIDKEGTNTWRYAKAGSKVIMAVSPEEIDIIRKTDSEIKDLDKIFGFIENEDLDIIFVEGFHSLIAKRIDVQKIITAKDQAGLESTLERTNEPIIAISGVFVKNLSNTTYRNLPLIRIPENGKELLELIKKQLEKH